MFPVHPRTRAALEAQGLAGGGHDGLLLLDPVGYLQFLSLVHDSAGVLTDSGGIQEETTALGIPCFTLRSTTERPVTCSVGTNTLLGLAPERIAEVPGLLAQVARARGGARRLGRRGRAAHRRRARRRDAAARARRRPLARVRLDVDLGFDAVPGRPLAPGPAKTLDLHAIAAVVRSPRRLLELLRGERYDEVMVREGELPLSALQAVALLCVSMVRAPRFIVDGRRWARRVREPRVRQGRAGDPGRAARYRGTGSGGCAASPRADIGCRRWHMTLTAPCTCGWTRR